MGEEELKKYLFDLTERVSRLETSNSEKWVTVKELAEIMNCTENTIYRKIRSGTISGTRQTGEIRIPMSQFYETGKVGNDQPEKKEFQIKPRQVARRERTMKELVFGR